MRGYDYDSIAERVVHEGRPYLDSVRHALLLTRITSQLHTARACVYVVSTAAQIH